MAYSFPTMDLAVVLPKEFSRITVERMGGWRQRRSSANQEEYAVIRRIDDGNSQCQRRPYKFSTVAHWKWQEDGGTPATREVSILDHHHDNWTGRLEGRKEEPHQAFCAGHREGMCRAVLRSSVHCSDYWAAQRRAFVLSA